ncbi:MAG: outer membrane beta-barrel protein [Bacteroidota bacterium]
MKKITLLVCLLCIAFVNAQDDENNTSDRLTFEKGTQFANANLSIGTSESNFSSDTQNTEISRFDINVNASYSYAISNNFFIGLGLGYSFSDQEQVNRTNQTNVDFSGTTYQIFPYVRYYKGIGKKFGFFIQGETRYSRTINKEDNRDDVTRNGYSVGVRPGLVLMLNKNLALETTIGLLGYSYTDGEDPTNNIETDSSGFSLSLNTSNLFFGVSYYF